MKLKTYLFKSLVLLFGITVCLGGKSQTFNEWFRQAKTQKKYLLEQIMAYQHYLAYLKKGYAIGKVGTGQINTSEEGSLQQEAERQRRLETVSPAVRRYPKVASILSLLQAIFPLSQKSKNQATTAAVLSLSEASYIRQVFDNLLQACEGSGKELSDLLTNGKFQLTDAERLERIDRLYADVQVKYTFAVSFSQEAGVLRLSRYREAAELQNQKIIQQTPR